MSELKKKLIIQSDRSLFFMWWYFEKIEKV